MYIHMHTFIPVYNSINLVARALEDGMCTYRHINIFIHTYSYV